MTRATEDQAKLDRAFKVLERCAINGERCPMNDNLGTGLAVALAHAGKIEIEVFAVNFRRVTILVGEHKGKSTSAPPVGSGEPYKVISAASAPTKPGQKPTFRPIKIASMR